MTARIAGLSTQMGPDTERAPVARVALSQAGVEGRSPDVALGSATASEFIGPGEVFRACRDAGISPKLVFGLDASCASIIPALAVSSALLSGGANREVLITLASTFGNIEHAEPTSAAYSNGAAAVVLRSHEGKGGLLSVHTRNDPRFYGLKVMTQVGSRYRLQTNRGEMPETAYKDAAVRLPTELIREAVASVGWELEDVDHYLFHQSRIADVWANALGIEADKVPQSGNGIRVNAGPPTILILLDKLLRRGQLTAGMRIAMCEIGVGLTCGAALYEW